MSSKNQMSQSPKASDSNCFVSVDGDTVYLKDIDEDTYMIYLDGFIPTVYIGEWTSDDGFRIDHDYVLHGV